MDFRFKKQLISSALISSLLAIAPAIQADNYAYATLDYANASVPSGGSTMLYGINDSGEAVGNYGYPPVGSANSSNYAFVYDSGEYTTLNDPNGYAGSTNVYGINNSGQIVGSFNNASGTQGFIYSNGNYTTISAPSGGTGVFDSFVGLAINNKGQVLGEFTGSTGLTPFVYDISSGSYSTLANPNNFQILQVNGLNDSGQVAGYYRNSTSELGFLYSNGSYTTISDPEYYNGQRAWGINNSGQVVGVGNSGIFQQLGYMYNGSTYTTIEVPSSNNTTPLSINNNGQIAGFFYDASGAHGFIATPTSVPLPATALLFSSAIVGFVGFMRRNSGDAVK